MNSILFVAPHYDIAQVAQNVFNELKLNIPIIIATNKDAVQKVKQYPDISVVISRGGTARDLKKYTDKLIVDVNISFSDIFTAIETLSQKGCKRIAIISSSNLIDKMNDNININGVYLTINPYKNDDDIKLIMEKVVMNNIDGIVGDFVPISLAKNYNIRNCIYIKSDELSVLNALKEALNIVEIQQKKRLRLQTLQAIIDNINEGIIVYNAQKKAIFQNKMGRKIIKNNLSFLKQQEHHALTEYLNRQNGKIIDINNEKMLLDIININVNNELNSDVLIFQKINDIEKQAHKIQVSLYQKGLYAKKTFDDIIYQSAEMERLISTAQKFAKLNSTILIYGETGTGKEGLAQSIHNASSRADKPFVSVNCASLPPTLIESELFGYVDGAFTGARKSGKKGLFELANTGTIFLDEIGDLPLDIQSRLLRVLQEREIMRIGDDKILPIDIRLICATNKNLKQAVQKGEFRQDLYYRINVLRLTLPPLRNRREDIMPIFNFYLAKYQPDDIKPIKLNAKIEKYLFSYPWYGNIRELKNIAEVVASIYNEDFSIDDLKAILDDDGSETQQPTEKTVTILLNGDLKTMEREIIHQLMEKNYSTNEICHLLNISRATFWRKIK